MIINAGGSLTCVFPKEEIRAQQSGRLASTTGPLGPPPIKTVGPTTQSTIILEGICQLTHLMHPGQSDLSGSTNSCPILFPFDYSSPFFIDQRATILPYFNSLTTFFLHKLSNYN